MSKTVTLPEILEDVRALFEIRSISLSDNVLARWANKALALLWDHIVLVNPDMVLSSDTISVVSGTATYALATEIPDFYKGHGLSVLGDDGDYYELLTFPWEERDLFASSNQSKVDQRYRYMGSNLHLAPSPGWSGTVKVWYIPAAPTLTLGPTPTSIDLFNSWDEFIVAEVAWKCAIKEGDPAVRDLLQRRTQLLAEIKSFAPMRDLSHHDSIRDVGMQGVSRSDPFGRLPWPR